MGYFIAMNINAGNRKEKRAKEDRTTLLLSLSVADKQFLKEYAADRSKTVAAVIHSWIEDHRDIKEESDTIIGGYR